MLRPFAILLLARSGIIRLVYRLMRDRRVPLRVKLIIPAVILYLLLPFDIIPDIIPISGWIDDILVTVVSLISFLMMAPREVVTEHLRGPGSRPKGKVIDGTYRVVDGEESRG